MSLIRLLLLLLPLNAVCATAFEEVFKSMTPVDKFETLDESYQNPLYRNLQLQLRTAGSHDSEVAGASRIALKLDLLAWGQRQKEKELIKEYQKFSKTINREGSSRECLYRGLMFSKVRHSRKSMEFLRELNQYFEDQNKLLKKGVGDNLFEFKELLTVRENLTKNKIRMSELEKLEEAIGTSLNKRLPNPVSVKDIDFKNFLTVRKMKEVGDLTEPKLIEIEKLKSQANIHNLELNIERREANQILDSIEVYRWDDRLNLGEAYGFQVSFNLPVLNKRAYLKDAVQRQIAVNKLSESQRELLTEIEGTELGFKNKITTFETLLASDYFKTLKSLKKLLAGSLNNSPLLIIQTKTKLVNERLKVLDLKQEITEDYLTKLYHSGKLVQCDGPTFLVKN